MMRRGGVTANPRVQPESAALHEDVPTHIEVAGVTQ